LQGFLFPNTLDFDGTLMEHYLVAPSMPELRYHIDLQTIKPKCGYFHKSSHTCSRKQILIIGTSHYLNPIPYFSILITFFIWSIVMQPHIFFAIQFAPHILICLLLAHFNPFPNLYSSMVFNAI
jgi:hypothetical protein